MSTADIDTFDPRSWLLSELRGSDDTQGYKYRELLDQFTEDEDWMLSRVWVHEDDGAGANRLLGVGLSPSPLFGAIGLVRKADYCLLQGRWSFTTANAREAADVIGRYVQCVRKKEKLDS